VRLSKITQTSRALCFQHSTLHTGGQGGGGPPPPPPPVISLDPIPKQSLLCWRPICIRCRCHHGPYTPAVHVFSPPPSSCHYGGSPTYVSVCDVHLRLRQLAGGLETPHRPGRGGCARLQSFPPPPPPPPTPQPALSLPLNCLHALDDDHNRRLWVTPPPFAGPEPSGQRRIVPPTYLQHFKGSSHLPVRHIHHINLQLGQPLAHFSGLLVGPVLLLRGSLKTYSVLVALGSTAALCVARGRGQGRVGV
jgi:hypothetical protein